MSDPRSNCEIQVNVRYSEVDRMGVPHHSRYWPYFEMARIELLRAGGNSYREVEDAGLFFVVAKCSARYRIPAMYDDTLTIKAAIVKMGRAGIDHEYEVWRKSDGLLLATAETTIACVDRDGRLTPIPDSIRKSDIS